MTDQMQDKQPQEQPEKKRQRKPRGRSRGEGSVFRRKTGSRSKPWVAQITRDGKKTVVGYYRTEAEAIAARNKALRDVQQGAWVDSSRQTVGEYLDYWLEHVHKPTIEPTTYESYRRALDGWLIPALGRIQVQKLSMRQVQLFYSSLSNEEGLGAGRVRFLYALLHCALDQAVKENLLARNVCDGVSLPSQKRRKQCVLTPEEAERLLASIQTDQMRMLILLAIVTGLRRGELLALKWQDIDFTKRRLEIRRGLVRITGRGLIEKSPKSEHSQRQISLPLFVIEALEKHRAMQQEIRRLAGSTWQEHDLVFCKKDGAHIDPITLDRRFKGLLAFAHLPLEMRLHDLRHSAITILLQMGVPAHVVAEIAGHSDVRTTLLIYGHVLPGQQEHAMEKWDGVLGEQGGERYTSLRQQWSRYNLEVQAYLEELLQRYGEGAVQIALAMLRSLPQFPYDGLDGAANG